MLISVATLERMMKQFPDFCNRSVTYSPDSRLVDVLTTDEEHLPPPQVNIVIEPHGQL